VESFADMGLGEDLVSRLAERGLREVSQIQGMVIPALLKKPHRLLFTSPTGTGKTLAYLLPLIQELAAESPAKGLRLLILAPTYELCSQIKKEADAFLPAPRKAALLIGSSPLSRQIDMLKKNKPVLAVGNPARIVQLVTMKKLSLRSLAALVFDECDRLYSDELSGETEKAAGLASTECRFIACSATCSGKARERLFRLGDWQALEQEQNDILRKNIQHWAFYAEEREKADMLRSFIAAVQPKSKITTKKVLVFTSQTAKVAGIAEKLRRHGLAAAGLWGAMDKKERKAAIDGFRNGSLGVLVASDLAARGLDIGGISHVAALDIPDDGEVYIHRAGRTARAGKRGVMASFGDETELRRLARLEKKLGIAVYPKELRYGKVVAPE
jgi:superfamily II DNA/RNA helicase